jgi:arginase
MSSPGPPYRPLDAQVIPRFAGIRTFMRVPHVTDLEGVDAAAVGIPFDTGTSYRTGARFGPEAIRSASALLRPFHPVFGIDLVETLSIVDYGDLPVAPGDTDETFRRVEEAFGPLVEAGVFPLVLGGDHSIAVGTLSAIAAVARPEGKKVGLLWVDAHGDINTPDTSPSGNIHGMPVAALLGFGPPELTGIGGRAHKVEPRNVALIGIRSLDEGEKRRLKETGVQVHTMSDIDRHGIHRAMKKALARITDGTDYVHVSFDLDAVDPTVAPGVGTPVKGGLDYREAHLIMELLHDSGVMTSLEMVEVNPILDQGNASATFAVELVQSAFGKKIL